MQEVSTKRSITGYVSVGILTVLVNLLTFQLFIYLGVSISTATFLGNLISIVVNYSGMSEVFKSKKRLKTIYRYVALWVTYYFSTVWIVLIFVGLSYSPLESRIASLIILTPMSYLLQKSLVFR